MKKVFLDFWVLGRLTIGGCPVAYPPQAQERRRDPFPSYILYTRVYMGVNYEHTVNNLIFYVYS